MRLTWLELRGFRSYRHLELEPDPGVNLLVGENAAGKTNLLEAVHYASTLRSFRGALDAGLVHLDDEAAVVRVGVTRGEHETTVEVELPRAGRRRALVNRQRLRAVRELVGHVRTVAFLPDDLDVIKRGPSYRRQLLDEAAVQLWPGAYQDQQDYERALRQRNALLRREGPRVDQASLDVWDARLAAAGAGLMARRAAAAQVLAPHATRAYEVLAGRSDRVELGYSSTWGGGLGEESPEARRTALAAALEGARRADLERGMTTTGPHRDEPVVLLNGEESRTVASQGEQRCLVLGFRLALFSAVEELTGERPILLLDDVFSELDEKRAGALGEVLPETQCFVTSARGDDVPLAGRRWSVAGGAVR